MKKLIFSILLVSQFLVLSSCNRAIVPLEYQPKSGKGPAVILLSGIDGPANYTQFADRLKEAGYYAVLFNSNEFEYDNLDSCKLQLSKIIREALQSSRSSSRKVVVIGYSLGGWIALGAASGMSESVSAVIAYYPATTWIHDLNSYSDRFRVPILVFQGEDDVFAKCCLVEDIKQIGSAAKAKGKDFNLIIYPKAGHAFNTNALGLYNKLYDDDSWQKTMNMLNAHLPLK